MTRPSEQEDLSSFEAHRADLLALAYRMLGDASRAEDVVQEAWLRWRSRDGEADSTRAYLVTIVARLCLNELDSARARREESRSDRLPEPVALEDLGIARLETANEVSMALLVALQRLPPPERAVLLLHEVFDFEHDRIATLLGKSPAACRKLLERARKHVQEERRRFSASHDDHQRLLRAFIEAASAGDTARLVSLLADDAVMISDGGPDGVTVGEIRNLPRPLGGAARVAAFVAAATLRGSPFLRVAEHQLNGQPAVVFWHDDRPFAALLLAVGDGRIQRVFFHADAARLRFLGAPTRGEANGTPIDAHD